MTRESRRVVIVAGVDVNKASYSITQIQAEAARVLPTRSSADIVANVRPPCRGFLDPHALGH